MILVNFDSQTKNWVARGQNYLRRETVCISKMEKFKVQELLEICQELNISVGSVKRKQQILEHLGKEEVSLEEAIEARETILAKKEERERLAREQREEEIRRDREDKEHEIRLKELELRMSVGNQNSGGGESKIKDLIHTFKAGDDIALYLVHFERACENAGFSRETWPQKLICVLPGEVSDVIARMNKEDSEVYDRVKAALLRKCRLSTEAFRLRFRHSKRGNESHSDYAYQIRANFEEWLKSAQVYGNHDKVIELMVLEQFYRGIPEEVRLWVQDRMKDVDMNRAAELAEDYCSRRSLRNTPRTSEKNEKVESWSGNQGRKRFARNNWKPENSKLLDNQQGKDSEGTKAAPSSGSKAPGDIAHALEARKPVVCYSCGEKGHMARSCKRHMAFATIQESEDSLKLLKPYMRTLSVNGRMCRVLRDSAATMDVAHPSCVSSEDYIGECAWIRQVAEKQSVCLPIARVVIEGPFGQLCTEAAISANLPEHFPYLFSNKSEEMLKTRGESFATEIACMALTRSKARELTQQLSSSPSGEQTSEGSVGKPEVVATENESAMRVVETETGAMVDNSEEISLTPENEDLVTGSVLTPASTSWCQLARTDRATLVVDQKADLALSMLLDAIHKEGNSRKNVSFYTQNEVLHRRYENAKGRVYNQVVVPLKYRRNILDLAHSNAWAGHLGIKKTKAKLAQEFYWPGCWKDVEMFVRGCDTCQRIGKSTDKWKAPMKLVPIVTEPFRRLVIDIVGPLPPSKSGYRYVLTALCVATKFPEAIALKELSSVCVVDALLSIFSRVGFPSEIQCDNGSVFTSCLTTTFLERCGIKIAHSSIHHPQSNPVERMHSVMKRVLRALCFEHKSDWEGCIPAAMFSLRSAPHESTGFSPAELVYGRNLRGPLHLIRESWTGYGEDPNVVSYVLDLLGRLGTTREVVESNMRAAQALSKARYDKSARKRVFRVGDEVMLLCPSRKNKLDVQWEGPATVLSVLSDTNYEVKWGRKCPKVYHSNLMKPYMRRKAVVNLALNVPEDEGAEILCLSDGTVSSTLSDRVDTGNTLSKAQEEDLELLVQEFATVFSEKPGKTDVIKHDIELTVNKPISCKPYRVSPRQREILEAEIRRMIDLGVIIEADSDFTSPLILVEIPGRDPRPCVDYRRLNSVTVDQTYPIPNIEERVETVSKAKYISTLDLVRGYWQVPLTERASRYAAFISPLGTFRPLMMSFGLKNAPYCFSRLMDKVLHGLEKFALPYLDDVAIFSDKWEDHVEHLRMVLERVKNAGLTVKREKCHLGCAEVSYLGHIVGNGRRRPSELKVAAVVGYRRPSTKTEMRAFLGLTGYYQHYVPNYSEIASPLTDSLRKTEPVNIQWDSKKEDAFQKLKHALSEKPVLRAPDFAKPFTIQCDASERGLGAVLCQTDQSGEERPVLYLSRKLSSREEAYSTSEKECACIVWAVRKLGCYVAGSKFIIETDHSPLTWLHQMSPKNGRLLRWSIALQQHNFEVRYKRGGLHTNADALSRAF